MGKKAKILKKQRERLYNKVDCVKPAYIVRWGDDERGGPCWGWENAPTRTEENRHKRTYHEVLGIKFVAISKNFGPTAFYEVRSRDTGKIAFVPMDLVTRSYLPIEPQSYTITHEA